MIHCAQRQARKSRFRRARVGAVIAKGDRILACGHNAIRHTKAVVKRPFPESTHAEQAAIAKILTRQRLHDLCGATIYVCRIGRAGEPRLSRPCPVCMNLIRAVGIKRVVYTTDEAGTASERVL